MIVISHFKSKAIQLRVYFPIPKNDGVFFKRIFFCVVCLNSFVVIYFVFSLSLSFSRDDVIKFCLRYTDFCALLHKLFCLTKTNFAENVRTE